MTAERGGLRYHLALRDLHASRGAVFRTAGVWSLPASYGAPAEELAALRTAAVVFDRSQRSRFMVTGTDASGLLARAFAGHVDELEEGRAMRMVSLDAEGRVDDLALIARTGGIAYLIIGEPGRRFATAARLAAARGDDFDVHIDDRTESTCLIGVAGPQAEATVREHLAESLPARLPPLHCVAFAFHGFRALAVRTSDVGEDGFEFVVAPAVAQHLVEALGDAGVRLAGNDACETARIEAGVPAWEPDLATGLTPSEADLDVVLGLPPDDTTRILAAVIIEGDPVPAGTPILAAGAAAGEVRSCVRSANLDATIALAVLQSQHALPGAALAIGGQPVFVAAKPLYRRRQSQ